MRPKSPVRYQRPGRSAASVVAGSDDDVCSGGPGVIVLARWPMSKCKWSIASDLRRPEGAGLVTALIAAPGPDSGLFLTNVPAAGWLSYERLSAGRAGRIMR